MKIKIPKINNAKIFSSLLFLILFFSSTTTFAQSVSVESNKEIYNKGDTFLVQVMLDSQGKKINSLGGTISVPKDLFEISNIQTKGSFVSLWTEKPTIISNTNEINFSGGLLGGYSGSNGVIFSFVLKVKKEGYSEIIVKDFEAFLNDGMGTEVSPIKIISLKNTLINNPSLPSEIYSSDEDKDMPENLIAEISRDSSIENNKYFVSFFAVDKDSGIKEYQVEESPWIVSLFGYKKVWESAQNPQVLKYQKWISTVKVTAIDNFGNITEEKVIKPLNLNYYFYILILLLTSFIFFLIKKNKREYNKNNN